VTGSRIHLSNIASVQIHRGFDTSRSTATGSIAIESVASLRRGDNSPRLTTEDEIARQGLEVARVGDVLVTIEGSIGDVYLVDDVLAPFIPSRQVATIRVSEGSPLNPVFLAAWLGSPEGKRELDTRSRGTTIQRIALREIENIEIPLPPRGLQEQIAHRYVMMQTAIIEHQKAIALLDQLLQFDVLWELRSVDALTDQAGRN